MTTAQQQWPRGPKNELLHNPLLSKGSINIDEGCPRGLTPLMIAAREGHTHVTKILLDSGANVSISADGGITALQLAAIAGHPFMAAILVKASADHRTLAVPHRFIWLRRAGSRRWLLR